jgi:hypothetical protein
VNAPKGAPLKAEEKEKRKNAEKRARKSES